MTKEELIQWLKENLRIETRQTNPFGEDRCTKISLILEGEVISEDYVD